MLDYYYVLNHSRWMLGRLPSLKDVICTIAHTFTTASGATRRISTTEGYIAAEEPICFGKLSKQGKHAHSWHRRWFVLRPSKLEYFKSRDQFYRRGRPKGSILLENIFNIERDTSKEFCLRLSTKHPKDDGWKAISLQ